MKTPKLNSEINKLEIYSSDGSISEHGVEMLSEFKEIKKVLNSPVVTPCIYPTLDDIRIACRTIANGVQDLTPMLNNTETRQLIELTTRWMFKLREHKEEIIDGMLDELNT